MEIKPFEGLSLSENQLKVFRVLAEDWDSWGEGQVFTFKSLEKETGIEVRLVRLACRALARKELAKHTVAVNQDYMPSGSGYICTDKGHEVFERMEELERVKEEATTI